ncbi:MAG: hypothetical protein MUE69_29365 [Myxococcota bacterium]|jgi:hypothetical protein|nr:hypothetical protein [Myxococcota bacterium]
MSRLLDLLDRVAAAEHDLVQRRFVAPCVPGTTLRVRVDGLVHAFVPNPPGFEGWGLFAPIDGKRAQLRVRPDERTVARYLALLPRVRLLAVRPAASAVLDRAARRGARSGGPRHAWWAMPVSREAFRRRFRRDGPVVVQLAKELVAFETIVARFDGASFWLEGTETFADPRLADHLRRALGEWQLPDSVAFSGLTPEHRDAYALALSARLQAKEWAAHDDAASLEARLRRALHVGGGRFESVRARDGGLTVEWTDRDGNRHASFLADDATSVRSAGAVCLQGHDADFDLTSLVGVVTDAPDYVRFD